MGSRRLSFLLGLFCLVSFSTASPAQESRPPSVKVPDMPEFQGIDLWLNSPPLTKASFKGKVVLIDFWTYTCINCLRTLPHLKSWYEKYKDKGLIIVGVHSPEFEFEKNPENVKKAITKFGIAYPVALDNRMATWTAFNNQFWPAHYFIDVNGKIRHTRFGEGNYKESEETIQKLLSEIPVKKPETKPTKQTETQPTGVPESDLSQIRSPETYLGFLRRERLVTSGRPLELNEWSYEGSWRTEGERIVLKDGTGKIRFCFHANKVNLVLHPGATPVKAIVRLDGKEMSMVEISEPRLYELINLGSKGEEHLFEIEFLSPGVQAYAFTFG